MRHDPFPALGCLACGLTIALGGCGYSHEALQPQNIRTVYVEMFQSKEFRRGIEMQLTEALAEYWHSRVRAELGFAAEDPTDIAGMFKLNYRGARFSLGYPACPDMEDRRKVVELLKPERMGVELSEELQLHPEQSTDAFVFHHPEARYFSV